MNTSHRLPSATQSRREFLVQMAAATAAACAAPALAGAAESKAGAGRTLVGSNIYGWGQYAERDKRKLVVEDVLSALRDSGYDYLENFMDVARPEQNVKFAEQMKARGLRPVSLYTGARVHEADKAGDTVKKILAAAKVCKEAGFEVISCNADPIGREKTDEELKTQVSALTDLGKGLNELGLKLGMHHHLPEMASKAREFHYVFRNTKPAEVGFCYDVHWVWKGGITPADALREYGDRVVTWHLRQSREGVWYETVDLGDVDYVEVAKYAKDHKLPRRFTVELALEGGTKITRGVVENHKLSREYVRRVFQA